MERVLTVSEACDVLGLCRQGVHRAVARGRIAGVKRGGVWLLDAASVESYRKDSTRRRARS